MDKQYDAFKEILEDQIKQIVKKGDISPTELENVYRASAIVLDLETREAMKKNEEKQSQQGQSQQGQGANAPNGGYSQGNYNASNRGSYEGGQSNHFPWFMYYNDGTYDRSGNRQDMSNRGNSYGPIWNQEEMMMHEMSNDGRSNNRGQQSRNMSNRESYEQRGNSRARGNSRESSRESYEGAYDGAYDGSYEGAYDGAYDGSNDSSYRRGRDQRTGRYVSRDRGSYSRAMDKERMIGKLEDMMDDAPSEKERRALQQCVDKLERQ